MAAIALRAKDSARLNGASLARDGATASKSPPGTAREFTRRADDVEEHIRDLFERSSPSTPSELL